MSDISGTAEVHDHRYSASRESFENHAAAEITTDGNTRTSADRNFAITSAWLSQPAKETACSIPSDLTSSSSRALSGPSPTILKRAKSFRKRGAAARKARSQAFRGTSPPTKISWSLAPGSELWEPSQHNDGAMPFSGTKRVCRGMQQIAHTFETKPL